MQLKGKTAVITGGGRGIGRGIVDRFRAEGAQIAIIQRRGLDPELKADPQVEHIEADLAETTAPAAIIAQVVKRFGGLDVLVNNAGIMFERSLADITVADWEMMAAINLRAPLFLAQAALPELMKRGGGSIINLGAVEGHFVNPLHTAYAATKAGIHGITRAMAIDLGPYGVRCNAIAPGWIDTDLSDEYLDSFPDPDHARQKLRDLHPVGRVGNPTDIGDLAAFLASDRAEFLTGEVIVLDGGRTVRLPTPN